MWNKNVVAKQYSIVSQKVPGIAQVKCYIRVGMSAVHPDNVKRAGNVLGEQKTVFLNKRNVVGLKILCALCFEGTFFVGILPAIA